MKLGKIAKQVLGTVAPMIATAVGGPFAPMAMGIIKGVLGTDDEAVIEQQLANADPSTLAKLREANQKFEIQMRELGIQEQQLYLQDTADARAMATRTTIKPQVYLAALFIGGYFIILLMVLTGWLTPAEGLRDMALILVSVLAGEVPRILSFFFGTTKSSGEKNAYLAAMMERKPPDAG